MRIGFRFYYSEQESVPVDIRKTVQFDLSPQVKSIGEKTAKLFNGHAILHVKMIARRSILYDISTDSAWNPLRVKRGKTLPMVYERQLRKNAGIY